VSRKQKPKTPKQVAHLISMNLLRQRAERLVIITEDGKSLGYWTYDELMVRIENCLAGVVLAKREQANAP
jgi:hypothetical protein